MAGISMGMLCVLNAGRELTSTPLAKSAQLYCINTLISAVVGKRMISKHLENLDFASVARRELVSDKNCNLL